MWKEIEKKRKQIEAMKRQIDKDKTIRIQEKEILKHKMAIQLLEIELLEILEKG